MKFKPIHLSWAIKGAVGLLIVFLLLLSTYFLSTKTTVEGSIEVPGISAAVTIQFDSAQIPHIQASSDQDAWYAIGFMHASERAWQMEFNRRLAAGRLAEILGPDAVGLDKFIRTLGIHRAAEKQLDAMPIEAKRQLQAYADGVNAGIKQLGWALPPEFLLTGTQPGHWSAADSVAWSLMMALDLGDNWNKEFLRLELARTLDTARIWEVLPPYPGESPAINANFAELYRLAGIYKKTSQPQISTSQMPSSNLYAQLPGGVEGVGSNNWVISGEKSSTGKPWLANDPHLSITTPAIWYFAHIQSPNINVIGATMPGIPTVILGRTENLAWGFTNTGPDVQDLFIEALDEKNSGQYKIPEGWANFLLREETIQVKGEKPQSIIVRESRHGPIISDVYPRAQQLLDTSKFALALRWTALDTHNQTILAGFEMNKAKDIREEFTEAIKYYYAPMQNIVMADTQGNIAYRAFGAVPKRTKNQGFMGVAPGFGWEKQFDWQGYIPYSNLPKEDNPSRGWIATANQRVQGLNDPNPLTTDWLLPFRYKRIEQLINESSQHDLKSMKNIQTDVVSLSALELLPLLRATQSNHPLATQAQTLLENYDGKMSVDSPAAAIVNAWAMHLTHRLLADKLGETYPIERVKREFRSGVHHILNLYTNGKGEADFWCDKRATAIKETCPEAFSEALNLALKDLSERLGNNPNSWRWGDLHMAVSEHRPMSKVAWLKNRFEVKRPIGGDGYTINVGNMTAGDDRQPYLVNKAASLRVIYDLSNLDQSVFIYQTGQSGWVNSRQYDSYANTWAKNEYLKLSMKPDEIIRTATLKPPVKIDKEVLDKKPINSAPVKKNR